MEALNEITNAEQKARQIIEDAHIKAREITAQAQIAAREETAAALQEAAEKTLEAVAEAKKRGEALSIKQLDEAKAQCERLKATAESRIDKAVATVVERVVG